MKSPRDILGYFLISDLLPVHHIPKRRTDTASKDQRNISDKMFPAGMTKHMTDESDIRQRAHQR